MQLTPSTPLLVGDRLSSQILMEIGWLRSCSWIISLGVTLAKENGPLLRRLLQSTLRSHGIHLSCSPAIQESTGPAKTNDLLISLVMASQIFSSLRMVL